jgi:hypothetical protein
MVIAKIVIASLLQVGKQSRITSYNAMTTKLPIFLNLFLEIVNFLKNKKRKEETLWLYG